MNADFEPQYGHPIYRDGNQGRGGGFVAMVIGIILNQVMPGGEDGEDANAVFVSSEVAEAAE